MVEGSGSAPAKQDISSKALITLVALTILISLVSTFTVLYNLNADGQATTAQGAAGNTQGRVNVEVLPSPPSGSSTGYVTLEINPLEPEVNTA